MTYQLVFAVGASASIIRSLVKLIFQLCCLTCRTYLNEMFSRHRSAAEGVTRSRSLKKTLNTPTAIKKNSHCLQLIYQVVSAFVEIQHSELLAKKE